MCVDHLAPWTTDLERCKRFYMRDFGATTGSHCTNPKKGFEACFIRSAGGARIEAMAATTLAPVVLEPDGNRIELAA
ncbi:MAG: hypothetical protein WAQ05_24100 [Rubrivivax sp.]